LEILRNKVTEPLANQAETDYDKISSIFHALKDSATLKLFNESSQGFKSGKETIRKLHLTPRKYYSCLKELTDLGIIESYGKSYNLSPVGKILHQIVFDDILPFVSPEVKLPDTFSIMRLRNELSTIDNYGDTARLIINSVDQAKTSINLSTRFVDLAIMQSILSAANRGAKLKILTDPSIDSTNLFKLLATSMKSIRNRIDQPILDPKDLRTREIPVSFIIVDDRTAVFEFPSREFKMAFLTTESRPVRMLSDYFQELWNRP